VAERAILVGLDIKGRGGTRRITPDSLEPPVEESLEELAVLAESAGAEIVEKVQQTRERPEAATLIGSGKVEELSSDAKARDADIVIFDRELTPTQQRNLENAFDRKVIDRTQLILDIFARRARTREGQLQVELAQLTYLLPRLAGRGAAMSRLGGGIGTRGPGETQLETDRRRIARRINRLEQELEAVRAGRSVQRRQRQSVPLATAALVGYTNAGKSTLFNRLTGSGVLADPRMFATLDPTVRAIPLPSRRRLLLSDTVGFIRNLPVTLVKAFRATLEEVVEAALVLHVVDAASPHANHQIAHVSRVLAEIGAGEAPQLLVLNKVDLIPGGHPILEATRHTRAVHVSARTGEGVSGLLAAVDEVLPFDPVGPAVFRIPQSDGAKISLLHDLGRVKRTRYEGDYAQIEADVPESLKRRLSEYLECGANERG
jgi:GTP-binding protein HflX